MVDEVYALKGDIQQCIAHGIDTFTSDYRLLFYENENYEMINALGCFESLEIKPNGTLLQFKGKIAKDLNFSEQQMANIKKSAWQKNMYDIQKQINNIQYEDEDIVEFFNELQEEDEENYEYRKPNNLEIILLKGVQKVFEEQGIKLNLEIKETAITLVGNFKSLKLNKKQLRNICACIEELDMFLIAPNYSDEEDDKVVLFNKEQKCESIRVLVGISLVNKK